MISKKTKPILCTVSVILVLLTALLLPIQVFAETMPKSEVEKAVVFNSLSESEDNANIVSELTERRDECSKHFRMDDGTIMAVTYDMPVHYKNDKGKWVEYDNSLIAENTATPDEVNTKQYSNKKSNLDIDLATNAKTDNLVSINSPKGKISWEYSDAKKADVKIKNNTLKHKGNEKFTSMDKLTSQASYDGIYDDVDLNCIVSTTGVKENIILNSSNGRNEFIIEYNVKGFSAEQEDDHTIKLYKGKKCVYTISAPCMYDSDDNISTDIVLKVIDNKAGKLRVNLSADKIFLNKAKYPVTIDPEVTLNGYENTETAQVKNTEPDSVQHQQTHFIVGKSSSNVYSGLIKLKNIQENYSDKNIVSAKVNLFPMSVSSEMEIEAYPITTSWTNSTATYNSVSYGSEIIDYVKTKANSSDSISLDLTKYVKKWANGTVANNGVYLKSDDNATDFGGYYCYYSNRKPTFIVRYKEYTGSESNLTSHSVPCGQDATFSVCDYTGSLSVRQSFFEENTSRLPLNIYATYHSARNAVNEQTGYGWHYSFNQTVSEDDNYYKYIDADGVDHYFRKETNMSELSDEDDLGYSLKKDNNNKITIDDGAITQTYESVDTSEIYKLKNEKSNDNNSNIISYTYNSDGRLTKITTSVGDYVLQWASNVIANIKTPDSKYMYFVYYGGTSKIARFTSVDSKASKFYYTSYADDGLLNKVCYFGGSDSATMGGGVQCSYQNNKVTSITELGKNGASRKALSITYNDDNTTEFKELSNNNKKEVYTFDNYGNTISVLNANGMITNSNDGSLTINSGADSYTKNYIEESNEPEGIGNSYYFKKTVGDLYYHNAVEGNASIDTSNSYMGYKSIRINNDDSQNATTVYHTLSADCFVGKKITLSSYVKINYSEKIYSDVPCGAYLSIRSLGSSGGTNGVANSDSISVTRTVNGWDRISTTLTVPENAASLQISLGLRNTHGTAWFDCMQLEEGSVANDYNALSNSDFSTTDNWKTQDNSEIILTNGKVIINGNGGEPAPTEETIATEESTEEATSATYTRTETETVANDVIEETDTYGNVTKSEQGFVTRTYTRTYEVSESNNESSNIEGNGNEDAEETTDCNNYIYQEVDVNKSNVSFVLSGSAKAQSVPLNSNYRTFGIALKVKYQGDSDYAEDHYQAFNAYTDSMQNVSLSVTPNDMEKTVEKVAFAFVYGYNKNTMEVKNAMLNYAYNGTDEEPSTEPEATDPSSTEPEATEPSTSEPENEDTLIDEEILSESINTDNDYMRTHTNYDSNGNYVTSKVDEAGNTTAYTNDTNGNVTQITDANGNSTSYSYDVHKNLLSVTNGNSSNTYTYNDYNELSKITHNGFDYNYTYDNFGSLESVKVGSQALITYTFDSNGNISKATYGNGDYLDYTYDNYARVTQIKLNSTTTLAAYTYNKKGLITKFVDGKSGETSEYCYDCNGNTLYKYLISSDGELLRVTDGDTEKTSVNGSMRNITNGTDNDGNSYVQNGNAKITTDIDDFGRTTKVSTKVGDTSKFSVNYTYKNVGDTHQTTNNVDEIAYKLGDDSQLVKYKYSYDSNGNITRVEADGDLIAKYQYDSLNQLKTAWDYQQLLKFYYNYDNSGNIVTSTYQMLKSGYEDYTMGSPHSNDYYYNNSDWGDQLTKFNTSNITYDKIGNPLTYRDGMAMTWSGRELQSITKDNDTYSFTYNLTGLRTKKNCNGTNTFYYYDDSNNLIGLKKGNTTVLFYYDSNGQAYSMSVGDNTYFFVKNLQGDITKIIDENGDVKATYAYDAWGSILSENEDNSIEGLNPFRYRGYVYDTETQLYYLQSRYYDPLTGRFINADDPVYSDTSSGSPLSTNMFAYCENNPVDKIDIDGYNPKYWINKQIAASDWSIIHSPKTKILFNCYGFAIGIYSGYDYNLNPGFKSNQNNYIKYVSVDTLANRVKADLKKLKRSGKIVSNANYKCKKNEILIAMRVTAKNYKYGYDYHFMKKDSDGVWKFKGGWSNWVFELKRGLTPSKVSWDSYYSKTTGILWWKKTVYAVYRSNVYTSKIIYMAITR